MREERGTRLFSELLRSSRCKLQTFVSEGGMFSDLKLHASFSFAMNEETSSVGSGEPFVVVAI